MRCQESNSKIHEVLIGDDGSIGSEYWLQLSLYLTGNRIVEEFRSRNCGDNEIRIHLQLSLIGEQVVPCEIKEEMGLQKRVLEAENNKDSIYGF